MDITSMLLNNLLSYLSIVLGGLTVLYFSFYFFLNTKKGIRLIASVFHKIIKEYNEQIKSAKDCDDVLEPIIIKKYGKED
jgi:predicted PurR-regulated permease PerM